MRRLFCLLLALTQLTYADSKSEARYIKLTQEIRCIVCQSQSIAESEAPLAKDLRQKVASLIAQKMTDEAIKDYLVQRYGQAILLNPSLTLATLLLWTFPFLALGVIAWQFFRRNMLR